MRDIALNATEDFKFTTYRADTGAPIDTASIAVAAYPDNSTTEITAGITVTQPFDSRTGLGNIRVVATIANGYAAGSTYTLVITTGTANSVSVVGAVLGEFTIRKNTPGLITTGIMQASTATTAVLAAVTSFADSFLIGATIYIVAGTGAGQRRIINTWTNSTDTAVVDAWTTTPDTTSVYEVYASPASSSGAPAKADVSFWNGTAVSAPAVAGVPKVDATYLLGTAWLTPGTAGTPDVNTKLAGGTAWGSGAITAASIAADAITAAKIADGAIDAATFATGAITAAAIAADAIGASELAADAVTEIQSGLALAATLAAVKTQTDKFVFTVANQVDSNVQYVNDVAILGDGSGTPFHV